MRREKAIQNSSWFQQGFSGSSLIQVRAGMAIKPYSWEQKGFAHWGQEVASLVRLEKLTTHGLPLYPFSQNNQYARGGSTWQEQGFPAEHRHITHQETCFLHPHPCVLYKEGHEQKASQNLLQEISLSALLKTDLGE